MDSLLNRFQQHWEKQFPNISLTQHRFLVAISGGLDSVVLAHLLKQSGVKFEMAHCNFGLRGEESIRDENFVRKYAEELDIPLFVINFETEKFATEEKVSIQQAARTLRYKWFMEVREKASLKYLLTAHHADDNIETAMMHFFRGTGIKGMTGIPFFQKEQSIIRPLLAFFKEELLAYAKTNNLQFVEDSSNKKEDYTRNFFRLNLLPQIKSIYPQAEENILQNIRRFTEANMIYDAAIEQQKKKLITHKGNEIHIPVLLLKKSISLSAIVWEIIKEYGFQAPQTEEVIKLLDAHTGSYILSTTHRIILNRNWLLIVPNNHEDAIHIQIEPNDRAIDFANGKLKIESKQNDANFKIPKEKNIACIDLQEVKFPLLLRPWKQGDYFYPLGMSKKKKLSRFFIDLKLSLTEKEKTWVIESDKRIIWIVGHRIDDRFKVKANSKNILLITLDR